MANWDFGGLNWSDSPILSGGNAGEPGNESYVDPFQLSQLDYAQLGYGGPIDYGSGGGTENGDAYGANNDPMNNPGIANWMKQNNYHLGNAYAPGAAPIGYIGLFGQDNKLVGSPIMRNYDDTEFGLAMQLAGSVMGTAGLDMAGWGSGFGGGFAGNAVKGATLGSIGSGLGGGNPFTGAAVGALSGGSMGGLKEAGYAPSQLAGVNNPIVSNMLDNSASAGVRAGLTGQNPWQAAAMAGATTGLNGLGQNLARSVSGDNNMSLYDLPGSGATVNGDFNTAVNATPDQYSDVARFDTPGMYRDSPPVNSMFQQPTEKISSGSESPGMSFSLPNMGQIGNWALNNAGDLGAMLYGMYSNNKARKQLGATMGGLRDLYSQNSPYAQNLRASLAAKDAAAGRRSQYGAREVQLQSNLAQMAAQHAPALYQMQNMYTQLGNQNMMGILNTLNKTGAFKGLQGMFGQQPQAPQLQAPAFGSNLSGMPNMFNPQGSAMYNPNQMLPVPRQGPVGGYGEDYGVPVLGG